MCSISPHFQLCACDFDVEDTPHTWEFYRFDAALDKMIVGSFIQHEDLIIHYTQRAYFHQNYALLLRNLNERNCFDIDPLPQPQDRLQLHFTHPTTKEIISFGFVWDGHQWLDQPIEAYSFEWEEKHEVEQEGKIENAYPAVL